ncbi:unnamed protein product [Rhizoctonia solani]|uniref:Uncharacterized protein n=1 Tax=Rhizoctonia solani TaxID=456999 RepID=A0A8H2Y0G6_9AGAM|nr:unnamed protein product [Rhizoctonia solani]
MVKYDAYYLSPQKREFDRIKNEFVRNNHKAGLDEWERQQQKSWATQRQEAKKLLDYINSTAASRSDELKDLKSERKEQICKRLRALGWEDKYFRFPTHGDEAGKLWNSLVEISKPLTDRTWTNILPKLTRLLEENRLEVDAFERQERRNKKFGKQPPTQIDTITILRGSLLTSPFPEENVICGWSFFANLYEEENSLDDLDGLFNEKRSLVCQKLLEWRTRVENQLVDQYISSGNETNSTTENTILTIRGSTDATRNLSDNARFLLRADTVFMLKTGGKLSKVDREHGPTAGYIHFPEMPCINSEPDLFGFYVVDPDLGPALDRYVRHAGRKLLSRRS